MKWGTLLTVGLGLGCASVEVKPPADPCAEYEQPQNPILRPYSGPQWVVGVGRASGVLSVAELKQKADAAAASDVASQLLVKVQATLNVNEQSSSQFGSTTRVQSDTRTEVTATELPGLKFLGSCHNPWNLTTVSIAVLHKGQARDVMVRQLGDDAKTLEAGMARAQESLNSGAVLQALSHVRGLGGVDARRRAVARLASILGDDASRTSPSEQLAALKASLAERKTAVIVATGESTFPQPEWAGAALTQAGWRVNRDPPAALKVQVTFGTCISQYIDSLNVHRARCPVDVALTDFVSGQVLHSFQRSIEGFGTNTQRAVVNAFQRGAQGLQKATADTLAALEQDSATK